MMSIAGVKTAPPNDVDGMNIVPVLREVAAEQRKIFWHYPHYSNQGGKPGGAIRAGDWKQIQWYEDGKLELYNLKNDIGEAKDLSQQEPRVRNLLRLEFEAWRNKVGGQMPRRKQQ
jgi:hypothetical protein